jgi:hypothetical protein
VHGPACMNRYACCFSITCSCCCVHACVRGCPRDRHHVLADLHSAQTRAWKIEYSYRNIREESTRKKGGARRAAPQAPFFYPCRFFSNISIRKFDFHARPKCTFGVGRPNIPVLIVEVNLRRSFRFSFEELPEKTCLSTPVDIEVL